MPQMSPMLWLVIYLYFILMFMFMMILINFSINLYKLIDPLLMDLYKKFYLLWFW